MFHFRQDVFAPKDTDTKSIISGQEGRVIGQHIPQSARCRQQADRPEEHAEQPLHAPKLHLVVHAALCVAHQLWHGPPMKKWAELMLQRNGWNYTLKERAGLHLEGMG